MKRKKWSEVEEQTLLSKYSDLLNSGTLAKLKTREKKFRPIADHVNTLHHLQDPIGFPFKWSWRDVSIKVQNMRHRYLGVKQKIRISDSDFNWADGEIHWDNFLKYRDVFGDIDLPDPKDNPNPMMSSTKNFGDAEGISGILGYGIDSDDEDEEMDGGDEIDEEDDQLKSKSKSGKKLRMVGARVLELREVMMNREEKRREREWAKEAEAERDSRVEQREETELAEMKMSLGKKEFEKRARLERELERERRQRMKMVEKWEEEEMEWREKMAGMQMEHEKQMMQMHADSCQNQLQVLGVVGRLLCQLFGSGNDGMQNLPVGLGDHDSGKPDEATMPSEFL